MTTQFTHSADGTRIAYDIQGRGPALVLVDCVGVSRRTPIQPGLAETLAEHFTVLRYDRRGKNESGNTQPYAPEREYEDLAAVIAQLDGPVTVYGFSSGATLALLAAAAGVPIERLTLLEPPIFPEADPTFAMRAEYERRYAEDPAAAHRWYNTDIVGVPDEVLAELPPPTAEDLADAAAHAHELTFLPGTPAERFAGVAQPTALIASDHTAPVIYEYAEALEQAMPNARRIVLPGEWHGVDNETLTAAIVEFCAAGAAA